MDSENDIYDANDVESVDDDCYGDDMRGDDDDCSDGDDGDVFEPDCDFKVDVAESYTVLKEGDIQQRLEEDITKVATVLSISRDAAGILLRHYDWGISTVLDKWFADEETVRKTVGLADEPLARLSDICGICFDPFPSDSLMSGRCGHPFCISCWSNYIRIRINDGPQCLTLRCPDPSCQVAVGGDMFDMFACDEQKEKYVRYLVRSYVEGSKKMKWCPAPDCDYAVEFAAGGGGSFDVSCLCSYSFCWNCTEEVHRPVDCAMVSEWMLKNRNEAQNTNWILAYTKPCPKCKRPIEKNHGCMHMTCSAPCRFEFCWLCLGAWSEHGYRPCNRYEVDKEAEKRMEIVKSSLEKYAHYYERWASNQLSRKKALDDLQQMQTTHLEKLSDAQCTPETQLQFITDAWLQIVECRRILKWTYAYGYYLPEHEHTKREFFEYLQGQAESNLERIHQCVEKELQQFFSANGPSKEFIEFRKKLVGLTKVTKTYFENLVRALENGLADVDVQGASSKAASSKKDTNAGAMSKGRRRGKGNGKVAGSKRNRDD